VSSVVKFDELTEDVLHNRIIKATVRRSRSSMASTPNTAEVSAE